MTTPLRHACKPARRRHRHCHYRVDALRAAGHGEGALGEGHALGIGAAMGRCRQRRQVRGDGGPLMAHGDGHESADDRARSEQDESEGQPEHGADPAIVTQA